MRRASLKSHCTTAVIAFVNAHLQNIVTLLGIYQVLHKNGKTNDFFKLEKTQDEI